MSPFVSLRKVVQAQALKRVSRHAASTCSAAQQPSAITAASTGSKQQLPTVTDAAATTAAVYKQESPQRRQQHFHPLPRADLSNRAAVTSCIVKDVQYATKDGKSCVIPDGLRGSWRMPLTAAASIAGTQSAFGGACHSPQWATRSMSTLTARQLGSGEPEGQREWLRRQQALHQQLEEQQNQQTEIADENSARGSKRANRAAVKAADNKRGAAAAAAASAAAFRTVQSTVTSGEPDLFRFKQEELWGKGYRSVCGVGVVGKELLAGPVVAAACIIAPHAASIPALRGSKDLTDERRDAVFELLTSSAGIIFSVGSASPEEIDRLNILKATHLAMDRCVAELAATVVQLESSGISGNSSSGISSSNSSSSPGMSAALEYLLVDGSFVPKALPDGCQAEAVARGEESCEVISAASLIAAVTRDRLMLEYDRQYPQYGFRSHRGHPTKEHIAAILKHGPSPVHRHPVLWLKIGPNML